MNISHGWLRRVCRYRLGKNQCGKPNIGEPITILPCKASRCLLLKEIGQEGGRGRIAAKPRKGRTMLACDVCGKCLTNPATGAATVNVNGLGAKTIVKRVSTAAMMISVTGETEQTADAEFLQRQLGPYQLGKTYSICYECLLRALGVKAAMPQKGE